MSILNKSRNNAHTAKGKARKRAGRVSGNRRLRTKRRAEEATGDLKQAADKVKGAFRH